MGIGPPTTSVHLPVDQDFSSLLQCLVDKGVGIWKVLDQVGFVHVRHCNELVHKLSREARGRNISHLENMRDSSFLKVFQSFCRSSPKNEENIARKAARQKLGFPCTEP